MYTPPQRLRRRKRNEAVNREGRPAGCTTQAAKRPFSRRSPRRRAPRAAGAERSSRARRSGRGLDNCLIKFSRCCTPIPGDDIVGYITRGQGVSIHRTDCANYARREFKPEDIGRWINVSWADEIKESYATAITVVSRERNGLIMDIASIFNTLNTKVRTINARDTGDKSIVNITLETSGIDELRAVVNRISALPGVVEVKRNGGKR